MGLKVAEKRTKPTYEQVQQERRERRLGSVRDGRCERCAAPVLLCRTRPPLSVAVVADPLPLVGPLEGYARAHGLMTWCLRRPFMSVAPDRLMFRCGGGASCRRDHDRVADHRCPDQKGRYKISMSDIYGTDRAAKRPEPRRDRWGRYVLPDPRSGEERSWQRVTTFCKVTTDQYNLTQWQLRTCAKGLSGREDLVALAATYDITEDAKKFNELCEEAKTAGGAKSAANTGTALHAMAEEYDETGDTEGIMPRYRPRVLQYAAALAEHGVHVVGDMIERIVCHTGYEVVGTLDRVFRLADGSYVIGDLKTGKNLSYSENEICVQTWLYAAGFNAHGVWDHDKQAWVDPGFTVREDISLVVHLPANNPEECAVYAADTGGTGRRGAELCHAVKAYRATKGTLTEYSGPPWATTGAAVRAASDPQAAQEMYASLIWKASSRERLIQIRDLLRTAGLWDAGYADLCRARAEELAADDIH